MDHQKQYSARSDCFVSSTDAAVVGAQFVSANKGAVQEPETIVLGLVNLLQKDERGIDVQDIMQKGKTVGKVVLAV